MGDAGEMEDGILVGEGVEAGVVVVKPVLRPMVSPGRNT
jgi:hypothetical protein